MVPISLERLRELYAGVARRSLRMETRQSYDVPWEDEDRAAWRRGDPEPPVSPELHEHRAAVRARVARGRVPARVRFLELPMAEYTAHEFTWGYPDNVEAGEQINIVDRAEHPEFDHVREDFVVFDDAALMYYRYTEDDVLTGYEYSDDPALVAEHVALAEAVWAVSTPYVQWVKAHGLPSRPARTIDERAVG